ncbi:hypothetical protein [Paenarthrobacter nicotinovorans]|uniref:hypothetical protein n=1 Tax=Paenarthrobacter nicotinovorans TaxID=29320 RepID=UPI0024852D07|nr:hypothetical protein [Paenarthrobacter nicotinovorans]MDI2019996.1 hypothetical protein [Paenarthrobacter nicotinovorans]
MESQKTIADKVKVWFSSRFAIPILIFTFVTATLGGVAGIATNWKTISGLWQPDVKTFSAPENQREEEIVPDLSLSVPFPLGWDVRTSDDTQKLRQAGDDYMTFTVGSLNEVDATDLPSAREKQLKNPIVRAKEVDASLPDKGKLAASNVRGFVLEYDANDGTDRKSLELVVSHNGKAVFARCAIVKRAVDAYRAGCMDLLDNVTLLPTRDQLPVLLFTSETAMARIWQSPPEVFEDSYDYLVSNWDKYTPGAPHKAARDKIPDAPLTSAQVVDGASTLAGRPIYFTALVDAAEKLNVTDGGGMRWVLQLTSNAKPGWRFYVQVNAAPDTQFVQGDVALVLDSVLVAGGATLTTTGGFNNTFYFLAQEVLTIPARLGEPATNAK